MVIPEEFKKKSKEEILREAGLIPAPTPPAPQPVSQRQIVPSTEGKRRSDTQVLFSEAQSGEQFAVPIKESAQAGITGTSPGLTQGTFAEQQAAREAEDIAVAQAPIEAERARIIAEESPIRRELDPTSGFGEGFPIFGGSIALGRTQIGEPLKEALGIKSSQDLVLTPQDMRTEALSRIEKQEIERGLTANEKFGAFIEGIPLIGNLANQFAGGLIETPSENAREVKSNILKEKRRIANIETNVKLGYLPVEVAQEQINDIEENIQRLESRIKLLINNSPELRFNSDYVNTVETEILLTREKLLQAKLNVLTGASVNPTEIQLLQQLTQEEEEDE